MSTTAEDAAVHEEYLGALSGFAEHCRTVLFGANTTPGPDGDLSEVPRLIDEARSMGLLADPSSSDPESDFGVWGSSITALGYDLSLTTLTLLAETCAGLAAAVHAHGIGSMATRGIGDRVGRTPSDAAVAAVFVPGTGTTLDPRSRPNGVTATVNQNSEGGLLRGGSPFVWASTAPDWLAIVARTDSSDGSETGDEWIIVAVPGDHSGVVMHPSSERVGLRAMPSFDVRLDEVAFDGAAVIARGEDALSLVRRLTALEWLGVSAIGLGTARAALHEATEYAHSRIQGGRPIIAHAAVRLLLAEASHDVSTLSALIHATTAVSAAQTDDIELLTHAISARLALSRQGFAAVSNCMQVLGGYGYMDDYGLSKRLRDVGALRSRHGSREQLLLALADLRAVDRSGWTEQQESDHG